MDLSLECAKSRGKKVTVLTSIVPRFRWGKRGSHEILFEAGRKTVLDNINLLRDVIGLNFLTKS